MVDGDLIVTDGSGEIAEQSSPKYFTMHTNGQTCVEPRKPSIQRTNNMNQPNIVAESIVIHTGKILVEFLSNFIELRASETRGTSI